jgi:hypothetical protein
MMISEVLRHADFREAWYRELPRELLCLGVVGCYANLIVQWRWRIRCSIVLFV